MIHLFIKIHEAQNKRMVAYCDRELLGKTLKDGDIHFEISEEFYGKQEGTADELRHELAGCTIANIIGERAVGVAIDCGAVDADSVIYINGVPHAQMMRL